jgi:hypothetical protein
MRELMKGRRRKSKEGREVRKTTGILGLLLHFYFILL